MHTYQLLLHGKGLQLFDPDSNAPKRGGVYVWRSVTTDSLLSAIAQAKQGLEQDRNFTDELWGTTFEAIEWEVDEVREKPVDDPGHDSGLIFYIDYDEQEG